MSAKRHVCLFGTSANPPTGIGGHLGIVKELAKLNKFDEIRVLPVYRHMFAEKRRSIQASFVDRMKMCQLNFKGIPNVTVSDDEEKCFHWVAKKRQLMEESQKSNLRVGTANLLDMLMEKEPSTEFTIAMGSDTFKDLIDLKWKRADDIIHLVNGRFVVFVRKFNDTQNLSESTNEIHVLQKYIQKLHNKLHGEVYRSTDTSLETVSLLQVASLTTVSSSYVRSLSKDNIGQLHSSLQPNVIDYILENRLYQDF